MKNGSILHVGRDLFDKCVAWCHWRGPTRIGVSIASAVAVCVGGWWLVQSPGPPVETTFTRATTSTTLVGAVSTFVVATTNGVVVVHVAGAVRFPGVVTVRAPARANDALLAAGGALRTADLNAVNLALVVVDGEQLFIPTRGVRQSATSVPVGRVTKGPPAQSSQSAASSIDAIVDLNSATALQLEALPGVGPSTAKAIVSYRAAHGPFSTVNGLLDVRGIGPAKLDAMRAQLRV
ncbi:MAG: helix-hairpin-helix domain-containing protein [Ilumatobacteraceae bacterium]|nr:helix-hairpin-helix domain-containing protein [Ilumatobacteraceae bacterium]